MNSPDPNFRLSEEQIKSFRRDGFLLVPDFISESHVKSLLAHIHILLESFSLEHHPMTRFTTGSRSDHKGENRDDNHKHVGDEYFLQSSDKIHYFFEPSALSPTNTLLTPKHASINKIGHALHVLDPLFHAPTINTTTATIVTQLGYRDPRVLQSMVICKQPEIGGAVPGHRDDTFLYTKPCSALGFWIALEACTVRNGCLSFVPGSQDEEPVDVRFVRGTDGGTRFESTSPGPGPAHAPLPLLASGSAQKETKNVNENENENGKEEEKRVWIDGACEAGTLVLIHGNVLHRSSANLSPKSRMVYTFHVIEGEYEYDRKNWLQTGMAGGFTKLVSGS